MLEVNKQQIHATVINDLIKDFRQRKPTELCCIIGMYSWVKFNLNDFSVKYIGLDGYFNNKFWNHAQFIKLIEDIESGYFPNKDGILIAAFDTKDMSKIPVIYLGHLQELTAEQISGIYASLSLSPQHLTANLALLTVT